MKIIFTNIFNQKGYTMIEMAFSIAIVAVLMSLGADFIKTGYKASTFGREQAEAVENGRKAMESVSLDVREAAQSERGDYPLASAQAQNFEWYGDINNDGKTEHIRYYINGTDLMRAVTLPDATNQYTIAGETDIIAQFINNQAIPIFTYYDDNNLVTANINEIRLVKVFLMVNVTPIIMPNDYEIETDIQLRNLKDNL